MPRFWIDCCARLYHADDTGDRLVPVSRDIVGHVLGEHGIHVAVSEWIDESIALEILDRAGARVPAEFGRIAA